MSDPVDPRALASVRPSGEPWVWPGWRARRTAELPNGRRRFLEPSIFGYAPLKGTPHFLHAPLADPPVHVVTGGFRPLPLRRGGRVRSAPYRFWCGNHGFRTKPRTLKEGRFSGAEIRCICVRLRHGAQTCLEGLRGDAFRVRVPEAPAVLTTDADRPSPEPQCPGLCVDPR